MTSSTARAVQFVELAIIAKEGTRVVDGVPFTSTIDAALARHVLAERAVAEASLLCRYVKLCPICGWCGYAILSTQHARQINSRLYHDEEDLSCAQAFDDECDSYAAERATLHSTR
ncbi:MAG TPA: hypothetical protein VNV25_22355 [Gemmatimonadaceae bacterium]|jgi:hypothetical protein|nr:hypothetical protein [Gemmatimonadaceae bacterium]